jgi:sigma-B regulation protein RsbU (phosphoserine phosphatase)
VYDYTSWDWYSQSSWLQSDNNWTDPYFDKDAGNVPMITFSSAIKRHGKFIGVVTVDIQLETLRRMSLVERSQATNIYILDRQGRFLLAPASPMIMNQSVFETASKMQAPQLADMSRRAMRGEQGSGTFFDPDTQEKTLLYFAPISGTGWALGCLSPESYFLGEPMQALRVRAVIGVVLVAVILGIVVLIGSWIVRPVARLAAAVQELGSGNLSATVVRASSHDEIGQLARGFNTMVEELRRHVDALTKETAARQSVESELSIAKAIQASMLPREFPPFPSRGEFELHAVNTPARWIGGDFFDYFFVDDRVLTIVVADVSGKGVPAAMFMAVARTVIRDLAMAGKRSPGAVLNEANALLVKENSEGMFVTMFVGQYDTSTGDLKFANAGHPAAFVLGAAGVNRRCGESTGTVLGAIPSEKFEERVSHIEPGERLVFFTDGVSEARSSSGEFYTEERFEQLLGSIGSETVRGLCERTLSELEKFQQGDQHDDITVLVLGRNR